MSRGVLASCLVCALLVAADAGAVPIGIRARTAVTLEHRRDGKALVLAGRLVDDQAEPIAGENLSLEIEGIPPETRLTDSDGRFEVRIPKEALLRLETMHGQRLPWTVRFDGSSRLGSATSQGVLDLSKIATRLVVTVAEPEVTRDDRNIAIDIALTSAGGASAGPASGAVVPDAEVRLRVGDGKELVGKTGQNGKAAFVLRPTLLAGAGTYQVVARFLGDHLYAGSEGSAALKVLLPTRLTLRIAREGDERHGRYRFSGRLSDENGPVASAAVTIRAMPSPRPPPRKGAPQSREPDRPVFEVLAATGPDGVFVAGLPTQALFDHGNEVVVVTAQYAPAADDPRHRGTASRPVNLEVPPPPGVPLGWYGVGLGLVAAFAALAHAIRTKLFVRAWEQVVLAFRAFRLRFRRPIADVGPRDTDPPFVTRVDDADPSRQRATDVFAGIIIDAHRRLPLVGAVVSAWSDAGPAARRRPRRPGWPLRAGSAGARRLGRARGGARLLRARDRRRGAPRRRLRRRLLRAGRHQAAHARALLGRDLVARRAHRLGLRHPARGGREGARARPLAHHLGAAAGRAHRPRRARALRARRHRRGRHRARARLARGARVSALAVMAALVLGQPAGGPAVGGGAQAEPGQPKDYALDADSWNGLGYLMTTAQEARVDLQILPSLDLDSIEPDDTVFLLYPTVALPVDDLMAFVDSGGFLVVADDHGTSGPLLAAAGIELDARGPTQHGRSYQDLEGLPILRPSGQHFLFFNVDEVVANYPAVLRTQSRDVRPILSFDGGREHLIVESPQGSGALLAIGDPSMFLNEMQRRFYGNKQLAANVLRFYCQREPCRARMLLPGGQLTGHYDARKHRLGTLPRDLEEAIQTVDDALADFSETLAEPPWAWIVAGVAALIALVLGLRAIARFRRPVAVPIPSDGQTRGSPPALDEARGLVSQRVEADFGGMAQTLGEQGQDLIRAYDLEGVVKDEAALGPRERQVLADAMLRVRAEAASLRSRQPPVVSADRFLKLHADVELLTRFSRGRRRVRVAPSRTSSRPDDRDTHA
ncbi:MAG: Ig-like domain-containing protein [Myxococcota bacterium]